MKYMAEVLRSNLSSVVFKIFVYGLRIIGLAPFSIRKSDSCMDTPNRRTPLFRYSKLGVVYNFSLVIPILFIKSRSILAILDWDGSSIFSAMNKIIFASREVMGLAAGCLPLIFWGLRQKQATKILNILFETRDRLSGLKHQSIKKRSIVLLMIHFTIHLVLFGTLAYEAFDYTSFRSFGISFLIFLPAFVIFHYKMQYSGIVGYIATKLQTVNQCLTKYQQQNYSSLPPIRNNDLTVTSLVTHYNDQLACIRSLRSIRATLIVLCRDIADFFSLPILICVVFSFTALFFDVYDIFVSTERQRLNSRTLSAINWTFLLVLAYVYPVTSLSINVTGTKKEVRLTGKIVNKLLAAARKGSEVRSELERFSRELRHDNDDIFTACGLFSLDSTLLPAILSSTVTYFVILVQLRPPTCDHQPFCNCSSHP